MEMDQENSYREAPAYTSGNEEDTTGTSGGPPWSSLSTVDMRATSSTPQPDPEFIMLTNELRSWTSTPMGSGSSSAGSSDVQSVESDDEALVDVDRESSVPGRDLAPGADVRSSRTHGSSSIVSGNPSNFPLRDRNWDREEEAENNPLPKRRFGTTELIWATVRRMEEKVDKIQNECRCHHTEQNLAVLNHQGHLKEHTQHLIDLYRSGGARTTQVEELQQELTEFKLRVRIPVEGYQCERCLRMLASKQSKQRHMGNPNACPP